jgi:hypothetical protein
MRGVGIVPWVLGCVLLGCGHVPRQDMQGLAVARDGVSAVAITIPHEASPATRYAGEELQRFLQEMTGAPIALETADGRLSKGVLVVGPVDRAEALLHDLDLEAFGNEEYVLRGDGTCLVIAGGAPRGLLYGVYGLLEDHLGCRWFTSEVRRIPKAPRLVLPVLDERVVPALEYREPFVMDCQGGEWAARNRMNSSAARLEEKHGGKVTYHGFVHTFEHLVPPETYYDTHPEYFSLVDGQRLRERSQLCCTNPEVVRIVTHEVRRRMRAHPDATVFSVSQNDWFNFCECDQCTALAEAEGSQMAPVLWLVNQVADAVADDFPDKLVDTLAYQYSRKAPRTMRPAPNVIVRLCSIECCFAHSFESCDSPENQAFVEDVKAWSMIADRLWVWNYNTSFNNYFTPYPNLRVRDDNIRFFVDHNVRGIFEQDVYTTLHGEFSELSGYLNAKLLWNPDYDEDTAINEFLDGVYGAAAPPIRAYIDLLHDRVETENIHMDIWIGPEHPVLDDAILAQADGLWTDAERAVAREPELLERVKVARLPVDFAIIERARADGLSMYAYEPATGDLALRPAIAARIANFLEVASRNGVTNMREHNGAFALYRRELDDVRRAADEAPLRAVLVDAPAPGLVVRAYDGTWVALPDFTALQPVGERVMQHITSDINVRPEGYGLVYDGYIRVP